MRRLLLVVMTILPMVLPAQYRWEGGLLGGGAIYQGDLAFSALGSLKDVQPVYGLALRRHLSPRLSLRAQLLRGQLSGSDARPHERASRGFSFKTDISEYALLAEWYVFPSELSDGIATPYLFAGGALLSMAPKPDFFGNGADPPNAGVKADAQAGYSHTRFVLPLGLGLRFNLSEQWRLGLELGARATFTDYIDGISAAANPEKNDWYTTGSLVVTYHWGTQDRDGDGIADRLDRCPELAGLALYKGCPDSDGDGWPDPEDGCPLAAGTLNGCPDSDADGIADFTDRCPDAAGPISQGGCPGHDRDGDGVDDEQDACPDKIGPASRNGCPIEDTDQDGIEDDRDQCPDVPGSRANYGCPEESPEEELPSPVAMPPMQRLFFEPNDAALLASHQLILNQAARYLSQHPEAFLIIKGHTDNRGNARINQALSEERARLCFDYLVAKGAPASCLRYEGYGQRYPIADNGTEQGRRQNNRVELELQ
ncbi:MAG: OmpA family protein [Phaeodactylibacter sp.]|nr:OmpA family protein [Phaeodactylibacter sp.]MCB9275193.1 OmpA family protein [Lewinellaceae bacterium]